MKKGVCIKVWVIKLPLGIPASHYQRLVQILTTLLSGELLVNVPAFQ